MKGIKDGQDLAQKLGFFEHLHMLVEEFDHAISRNIIYDISRWMDLGMENLGLWPDIMTVTEAGHPEEIRSFAYWTISTAAHHNPKVQAAVLQHGALQLAFNGLQSDPSPKVRQKCVGLISALVKQSVAGFVEFTRLSGIQTLSQVLATTGTNHAQSYLYLHACHVW